MSVAGPYKVFAVGSATSPTPGKAGWYYPIYLDEKEAMKADISFKGKGIYFTTTFIDREGEFYLPENYKFFGMDKDPIIYENYVGKGRPSKFEKIQNKLSSLVPSQLPDFVQEEYQQFINFLKAYYQFLERDKGSQEILTNIRQYTDIDKTSSELVEKFLNTYAFGYNPSEIADNKFVLKRIRDVYEKKGTEEAYNMLFNILYRETIEFFYPNTIILRASDGQWKKRGFLRSVKNNDQQNYFLFEDTQVKGLKSNATTVISEVKQFNIPPYDVYEFEIDETFTNGVFTGERITGRKTLLSNENIPISANLLADIDGNLISSISVTRTDPGYEKNQSLRALDTNADDRNPGGVGSVIRVGEVNNFNRILSVEVLDPGINYSANILIVADRKVPVQLANFYQQEESVKISFQNEHDYMVNDYIHVRHVGLVGSNLLGQYYIVPVLNVIDKFTISIKYPDVGIGLGTVINPYTSLLPL